MIEPRDILLPNIEVIARVCHEANRVIQIYADDPQVSPTYDLAPEWQKASAKQGVQDAIDGRTPEELHQSWCDFKLLDGWRYGPKKDELNKTHPCLVDYSVLPEEQKLKDHVFASIVMAFEDHAKAQIQALKIWDDSTLLSSETAPAPVFKDNVIL